MVKKPKKENDKFKIAKGDGKLDKITNEFHKIVNSDQVSKKNVEALYEKYGGYSAYFQKQYLAHFMRGTECYVREILGDKRFIIVCEPYDVKKKGRVSEIDGKKRKSAVNLYYPSAKWISSDTNKTNSFIIQFDESLDKLELRDYIAHELGHLLLIITLKNWGNDPNKISRVKEAFSSVFGIFIMSEKSDFYLNVKLKGLYHKNWQELFNSFLEKLSNMEF